MLCDPLHCADTECADQQTRDKCWSCVQLLAQWTCRRSVLVRARKHQQPSRAHIRLLTQPCTGTTCYNNMHTSLLLSLLSRAAAVYNMCKLTVSSNLILSLLELCVSKSETFTDYISCLSVFTATLELLGSMSMVARHTVCQQVCWCGCGWGKGRGVVPLPMTYVCLHTCSLARYPLFLPTGAWVRE